MLAYNVCMKNHECSYVSKQLANNLRDNTSIILQVSSSTSDNHRATTRTSMSNMDQGPSSTNAYDQPKVL